MNIFLNNGVMMLHGQVLINFTILLFLRLPL